LRSLRLLVATSRAVVTFRTRLRRRPGGVDLRPGPCCPRGRTPGERV